MVDTIASHLIGKALYMKPALQENLYTWINHENMWVRRTALITQLTYKKNTNHQLFAELILKTAHEKEFFIRKAICWALRQTSKTKKEEIKIFLKVHGNKLSPLSYKEASKYYKEDQATCLL